MIRSLILAGIGLMCGMAFAAPAFPGSLVQYTPVPEGVSDGFPIVSYHGAPQALDADTTIRVCVLKVEFLPDYTDSTSGNGEFESDSAAVANLTSQVESYYTDVSNGYLELSLSQFPASDGAFKVEHQMGFYGSNEKIGLGQCQLFRDAVLAADDQVDFSEFDAVIVMHAGAGAEADILGNSQLDIHSMFLNSSNLEHYLGTGFIQTDDGVKVREGCIDPEREAQDNYGLGVLGTIVHEFGHQLGLPDLYNTYTGSVGVGGWDVMGYGQWLMNGYWPSAPGAWSRIAMGWLDSVEITPGEYTAEQMGTVYRVPLNSTEYLLIENRQRDPNGDGQCGPHERDYGLPGSGLLIWHIDETRLGAYRAANIVNVDPVHKGVDVEEADGIQDLDYGFATWFSIEGSKYDPWKRDGYAWEFSPETTPSTDASWGGYTGVKIDVLDDSANSMRFVYSLLGIVPGWPVEFGGAKFGAVFWNTSQGDFVTVVKGNRQAIATPANGNDPIPVGMNVAAPLVVFSIDGSEYLVIPENDGEIHMRLPDFSEAPGWPVDLSYPAIQVIASESMDCVFAILEDRTVYRLNSDGSVYQGWPKTFSIDITGACLFPHETVPGLILVTADGSMRRVGPRGGTVFGWPVHPGSENSTLPIAGDFDRDGAVETAVVSGGKLWVYDENSTSEPGFPVSLQGLVLSDPFMADLDGDGNIEILVETTIGIEAFSSSGTTVADWPFTTETDSLTFEYSRFTSGIGGSGFACSSLRDGRVFIWNGTGVSIGGSPYAFGDNPIGYPILREFDGESQSRLMFVTSRGVMGAFFTGFEPDGWNTGMDRGGERCWPAIHLPTVITSKSLLEETEFFVWPNPVTQGTGLIRFVPGRDAQYRIRIFNVAGELVADYHGDAPGRVPWEVEWGTNNLAPGVYYVCLELTSSGETAEALFHAAVVN
ncbi:MAG: M6 family metalloprotease domain-containing protein [Candidatus Sabulitectum sp.]|nr:M6 family metalloprotease domain-containing protein [Candidatus Sabulitectum sp.]